MISEFLFDQVDPESLQDVPQPKLLTALHNNFTKVGARECGYMERNYDEYLALSGHMEPIFVYASEVVSAFYSHVLYPTLSVAARVLAI